jgi:hypothetical protein
MVGKEKTYPYLVGPIGVVGLIGLLIFAIPENDDYVDWKAEVISTSSQQAVVRRMGSNQTTKIAYSRSGELRQGECVVIRQNKGFSLLKKSEFILEMSVPCEQS